MSRAVAPLLNSPTPVILGAVILVSRFSMVGVLKVQASTPEPLHGGSKPRPRDVVIGTPDTTVELPRGQAWFGPKKRLPCLTRRPRGPGRRLLRLLPRETGLRSVVRPIERSGPVTGRIWRFLMPGAIVVVDDACRARVRGRRALGTEEAA